MEDNNNPQTGERPMSAERRKRVTHLFRAARELIAERGVKVETEHVGFRASIKDGVSLYLHAGTDDLSVEQEVEVMTPESVLHVSFQPHSLSGKELGLLAGAVYRIGRRGVQRSRGQADEAVEPPEYHEGQYTKASDTEVLGLSVFLSRALQSAISRDRDNDDR